jgi:hypothetical protein
LGQGGEIVQLIGYGEDALTLWAVRHKLGAILQALGDLSDPSNCVVFYRPSFGRSGGDKSPQFGEFDFIILAQACLYLGESKWDRSSKMNKGELPLNTVQQSRHRIFRFYVKQWMSEDDTGWGEFLARADEERDRFDIKKPLAPENSLLAENLQAVLEVIRYRYSSVPRIRDVLLYLHKGQSADELPAQIADGFELVLLDYSEAALGNFVKM